MSQVNQIPGELHFKLVVGDSFSYLITIATNSQPVNLTGHTLAAEVHGQFGKVADLTITPTDLAQGKITLSMTHTASAAIKHGTYQWSLKWTQPDTDVRTLLAGNFTLVQMWG